MPRPTDPGRERLSQDRGGTARCDDCGWTLSCKSSRAALGHGKRHHNVTGHDVQVELHRAVTYSRDREAAPAQTSLI